MKPFRRPPPLPTSRAVASILAVASLLALLGCGGAAGPPGTTQATSPAPTIATEEIARAIRFREAFGLPAGEAWIRHVAIDPSADSDYGVPLTPEERAIVEARLASARSLINTVKTYAGNQPEYAGALIDIERGAIVVVMFSGRIDEHREALARIVPADARLEVHEVRYTREELLALSRQVASSTEWMRTVEAAFVSSRVDTARNLVRVEISSANPDASAAIIAHYGAQGRMYVESDGTGVRFMRTGTLVIVAVDRDGQPVPGLAVTCTGDLPGTGTGDIGLATDENGEWRSELTATGYTCELLKGGGVVASGRALVEAEATTTLRMALGP